jgi:toxin-antitoxin system PIN domain toxin
MILVDTNLLLYAVNGDSPHHPAASTWLTTQIRAGVPIGLPWLVLVAFVRLTTSTRVFPRPLTIEEAMACVNDWLSLPTVNPAEPAPRHWNTLQRLLLRSGAAGNLTNDAHIAAIAIDRGCLLCSADNDFHRFEGLQFHNPLDAGSSVREPSLAYG